jgi:hypothetical protein
MGNNLTDSAEGVFLLSGKPTHKGRCHADCLPSNWERCVGLYSARKLVQGTWVTDKDEYLAPNTELPGYPQWLRDCHVYVLLHPSNNCVSMRQVPYKGLTWDVKNHWFWKSRQTSLEALDSPDTANLYRDTKAELSRIQSKNVLGASRETWAKTGDPYLGYLLGERKQLSEDAQQVLTLLDALWVHSLPFREGFAASRPELHLLSWDASIYQLKHLFKELSPLKWKELTLAHKSLATRLSVGVYEYGFLLR